MAKYQQKLSKLPEVKKPKRLLWITQEYVPPSWIVFFEGYNAPADCATDMHCCSWACLGWEPLVVKRLWLRDGLLHTSKSQSLIFKPYHIPFPRLNPCGRFQIQWRWVVHHLIVKFSEQNSILAGESSENGGDPKCSPISISDVMDVGIMQLVVNFVHHVVNVRRIIIFITRGSSVSSQFFRL